MDNNSSIADLLPDSVINPTPVYEFPDLLPERVNPVDISDKLMSYEEAKGYFKTDDPIDNFDDLNPQVQELDIGPKMDKAATEGTQSTPTIESEDDNATLKQNEGFRSKVYKDSRGFDTIGYGHKLTEEEKRSGKYKNGITQEQAEQLLIEDERKHTEGLYRVAPWAKNQPPQVQEVLKDMAYNMGPNFIKKWPKFARQIREGKYKEAAENMLSTPYAVQVKGRAVRNANKLRNI